MKLNDFEKFIDETILDRRIKQYKRITGQKNQGLIYMKKGGSILL